MDVKCSFNWATIILAAGSSSRLGQAKQLISIEGEMLLQKTIKTAIQVGSTRIVVMTGANRDLVAESLRPFSIELVHNADWAKGMGSSLKCGINFVMSQFSDIEAVLVLVCDQPLLTAQHLEKILFEFSQTKSPIIGSFYSGKNGVPVLFHKSLFHELLAIDDQHGAKRVIEQNSALVKSIDFPNGAVDIDTPEDLLKFQNRSQRI